MQITTKNFKKQLAGLIVSAKSQRDKIQLFIEFGLKHYETSPGDSIYLTQVLNACVNVQSLPTLTIKDYIKAHANLRWSHNKVKVLVFKKVGDKVVVKMPTVKWYDWKGGKHNANKADMDVMGQAKSFLTRLNAALVEGKVKDVDAANRVKDALRAVTIQ